MTNLFSFIPLNYLAAHPDQNTTKIIIKANVALQDGCREEKVAKISPTHIATCLRVENLELKKDKKNKFKTLDIGYYGNQQFLK